ncbi:TraB/GumN family protein [Aureibaculum sp. 2210JD6-5]|uniref:TraB/GumN family protein n=1 Tax=Aureibaculum sp. 2210JD6-5 TaxID=3103957 RepID=UPI002AAD1006|nr:TraB/GumN family protein [Aureibaculum sp. 2210JD6-5]MDY7395211.1 TraB/GumN family protein [Aureibaculum sp. 2210JD6-5]
MKKIILILLLLTCTILTAQQKYQSLLWKISGNNLEKDSYLYGTMHVSSKVAFRLDDVFYKSLEKSEVIALESDPTEWLANSYEMINTSMSYYGGYNYYNTDFYGALFELSFPKKLAIRNAIRVDNSLVNSYLYRKQMGSDNFEEETYLDMFIYQAGKKNHKPVVGLEDFNESRYLVTKASYNAMKKQQDTWLRKLYEEKPMYTLTEDAYRDRNLDLLDSIGEATNTEHFRKFMLYQRNQNMVDVLDTLMQKKSVFTGIGAAHLPGENGVIEMLRREGYTVTALTSKRTSFASQKKSELESTFVAPKLNKESTPDGFLSIQSFEKLLELNYSNQKYYIATDMANGGYLAITRISTFDYLNTNGSSKISLDDIDHLLYEDIPGKIIKKEMLATPYPGISILNKTKKNDYQKYHIYKTPLEIVIIKLGGKGEYALNHEDKIFNSISFKPNSNKHEEFTPKFGKYSVKIPQNYSTASFDLAGKNLIEAYDNKGYYFLQEVPIHDVNYIEEDQFEAEYIHKAFYKNLKLKQEKGKVVKDKYASYQSHTILDATSQKELALKSIVKDETYYLLGYVGKDTATANNYFNSFKLKDIVYKDEFKIVRDTSLYFTVKTNTKQPFPMNYYGGGIKQKSYETKTKNTQYNSKTNESIKITRTKYHDLQMYANIDSLWNQVDRSYAYRFNLTNKQKQKENGLYTYSFLAKDSLSAKRVRVKNILKKGVLFELKTMEDSLSTSSKFVETFYKTFTPLDTLLGRDVFENKVNDYFTALKNNDSIADNATYLIDFTEKDVDTMIKMLNTHKFSSDKKYTKGYIIRELSDLKSKKVMPFLKQLYIKSYNEPETQIDIIKALIAKKNIQAQQLVLDLLEDDFPIGNYAMKTIFDNNSRKDSLRLKKDLFPELLKYSTIQEYKTPIYSLLSRLKDSSLVKPKIYKKYKEQLLNDAKIELKRSLMDNSRSYGSAAVEESLLGYYVNLLYPYKEDKSIAQFYSKLLESNDVNALITYYVLLEKNGLQVPKKLKDKTLNEVDNISFVVERLAQNKILLDSFKTEEFQQKYAQSKLFANIYRDKERDEVSFFKKEELKVDGKDINVYFFKLKNINEYANTEWLHYIAFEKNGNQIKVKSYFLSDSSRGFMLNDTKTEVELVEEGLNFVRYKDRKRLSGNYHDVNTMGIGY